MNQKAIQLQNNTMLSMSTWVLHKVMSFLENHPNHVISSMGVGILVLRNVRSCHGSLKRNHEAAMQNGRFWQFHFSPPLCHAMAINAHKYLQVKCSRFITWQTIIFHWSEAKVPAIDDSFFSYIPIIQWTQW